MASSLLRPLSIGEILDGAFTIYRKKFTTLVGMALICMLPSVLLFFVEPLAGTLVQYIGNLVVSIAGVWLVSEVVLGREASIGDGLRVGAKMLIPFLAAGILYGVGITIATMLLIIPGILFWFMAFAWMPVVVLEKKILFLTRSRELAKGVWGKIFIVSVITWFLMLMPALFVVGGAAVVGDLNTTTGEMPAMFMAINSIVTALTMPFASATVVLLYYDQRVRKDGLDVELSTASIGEAAV